MPIRVSPTVVGSDLGRSSEEKDLCHPSVSGYLPLPLEACYFLLPIVGVALNGTSSVLYASVAEFVTPERHSRGFGLFMTLTMGAWAIAPAVFGVFSDLVGVALTMLVVSLFTLTTIPLALGLACPLRAASHSRSK